MLSSKICSTGGLILIGICVLFWTGLPGHAASPHVSAETIENALSAEGYHSIDVELLGNDRVELSGEVEYLDDKYEIYNIAAKFPKVQKIVNAVRVKESDRPDSLIKKDIIKIYRMIHMIDEPEEIQVSVGEGIAQLSGTVDFHRVKVKARTAASWIKGVRGIINDIQVEPPESSFRKIAEGNIGGIETQVRDILMNWYPQERDVRFLADDDTVTLKGEVSSLGIKKALREDISKLLGVKYVYDELDIRS